MRRRLAIVSVAALMLSLLSAVPAWAAGPPISLTFRIDYLKQIENADGTGDYFPRVRIADGPLHQGPRIEDDEFSPLGLPESPNGWTFTKSDLPGDVPTVPITVTMWDYDSFLNGNDDRMDISPIDQDVELNLVYDLRTRTLSGDGIPAAAPCVNSSGVDQGQYCIQGDGDHGFPKDNDGRITRIAVSVEVTTPDTDGDGIPDVVELSGIRNAAGDVLVGPTDPCRKTIILQLDWMAAGGHSHEPKNDAMTLVRNAFEDAPVEPAASCPYVGPRQDGIEFVHRRGVQIAEQDTMGLNDDNDYRNARTANLPAELAPYAHYGMMAHDLVVGSGTVRRGVSGQCCEPTRDNNKDFIVTLGSWRTQCVVDYGVDYGGDGMLQTTAVDDDVTNGRVIGVGPDRTCDTTSTDPTDRQVLTPGTGAADAQLGTVQDQAGTIMHELGHALNLAHGGDSGVQYKPNYLSVMNYFFQTGIPNSPPPLLVDDTANWRVGAVRLDFSDGDLPQLVENALDENVGIRDGADHTFWYTDNLRDPASTLRPLRSGPGNGPLNWNDTVDATTGAPIFEPTTVNVDLNASGTNNTFTDHDDWAALRYRAAQSPDVRTTACSGYLTASPSCLGNGEELDYATVANQEIAFFNQYDPDIALTKTVDKADAEPGEQLTYRVKLDNAGPGGAYRLAVTDTPETRSIPYLAPGNTATETFTSTIPCTTADGTVITNRATVTAQDTAGGAEANTANNSGTAQTTVHAPKLTLTRAVPATVKAGEAVKVTLTARNTGGATAQETVITDTLPKEVYYSQALDQGAGPRPGTVTRNADGTTTLTWTLGSLSAAQSGTVEYTARPSLLFTAGATLTGNARATYKNGKGCGYDPATATSGTGVTEASPGRDPRTTVYWTLHPHARTTEFLARVQATDQRFDADGDGRLSDQEALGALTAIGLQPKPLKTKLLTTLLNLSERRINASTRVSSLVTHKLDVTTVGGAVRHTFATLELPADLQNTIRYLDASLLLDEINTGLSERY
ncbi:DUF11 domain-containing protein [Herbidospora galbida]|uniref:DUF11 domain-containing protein n=1 Tax=Herbidospora galbida TaxID=2575442 RepID=A0A4U3LZ73_9ACTN|nr:DUF11 domain-containing protein [Herbidospora galbida]TKK81152.1 DUF11 domain-containing protein [Herbidospora galbida]